MWRRWRVLRTGRRRIRTCWLITHTLGFIFFVPLGISHIIVFFWTFRGHHTFMASSHFFFQFFNPICLLVVSSPRPIVHFLTQPLDNVLVRSSVVNVFAIVNTPIEFCSAGCAVHSKAICTSGLLFLFLALLEPFSLAACAVSSRKLLSHRSSRIEHVVFHLVINVCLALEFVH